MAVSPCDEVQDAHSISIISEKDTLSPQCSANLNYQGISQPIESPKCADSPWDCKNCTILQIGSVERHSPYDIDIDIKKESLEASSTDERITRSLTRTESSLRRASQRKISLQFGEKIMQLLLHHNIMLLKCASGEKSAIYKVPDPPNSTWHRYKRAVSFDSRKVVLLFSLLSSFGTLVLIYLTLQVKQINDGAHV